MAFRMDIERNCAYCTEKFIAKNTNQFHCSQFCLFWSKVKFSDKCWEWQAGKDRDGYGTFSPIENGVFITGRAHRFAWQLMYKREIGNLHICHSCDNPPCVRPGHLWRGTVQANKIDSVVKRRHGFGVRNGRAKLTNEDITDIKRCEGHISGPKLGKIYDIDSSQIYRIWKNVTWRHLARILLIGCVFLSACDSAPKLTGRARAIDGDTLDINGTRVRLANIDAEELSEPNGKLAKQGLEAIIAGQPVRCESDGTRSYNRFVATCYLPDGTDIAARMVYMGMALDCQRYSNGKYRHLEPEGIRVILKQAVYC